MNAPVRQGIPLRPDPSAVDREQRRSLLRAITGIAFSTEDRSAEAYISEWWPRDHLAAVMAKSFDLMRVIESREINRGMVERAAVAPLTMASSGLPGVVAVNVLPIIAPHSAALKFFARCWRVDLTRKAQVSVPRRVSPVLPPVYVAEGGAMPMLRLSFTPTLIGPVRKILLGSAVTNELEQAGPETASEVIGRLLESDTTLSLDAMTFDAAADDGIRPAGLLHGLSSLTPAAGSGLDAISKDVGNLAGSIADARIAADDMILICNPRQAVQLKAVVSPKFDYLVLDTPMVPDKRVIAVAPASVATAFSGIPTIERVQNALIQFEDTNPQNIGTPGSPNVVAAPASDIYQTDMTAIRLRANEAFGVVAPGGVAFIDNVNW